MPDYKKIVKFKIAKTVDPYLKQYLPKEEEEVPLVPGKDTMIYVKTKRGLKPEEDIRWSTTLYEVRSSLLRSSPTRLFQTTNSELTVVSAFSFLALRFPSFRESRLIRSLLERGALSLE